MILLRLLALVAGGLVLVAPPMFMFATPTGPATFDGRTVLVLCAGLALVASSFFFIALAGEKMRRSALLRAVGGVLLAVPFVGGAVELWRAEDAAMLWLAGLLMCFAVVLFVAFVYPASRTRKHRPMREREREHKAPRLVRN